ncbi:MAG: MotA/TolQ/ExbB proton channel family protein [bacterium]|uniref:MotA/TolQ/ExbB proton channel n=2 Tax=Bacteria candidate phyla TaxID=1783234 RepID=A0A101I290_UNCT6|nr:MAG: MotA/TolQ/ExbB proton channel [candidate division TA06 bacterium 32_111]KUK87305.1 MAG: MotA/TolQ/ExbB proton channel [candidate division TA06 bacterium 34_109]MDI6700437.1 MotA/TolQ/ExbB proton channel family protein [bacterium]HAF07561.1 flagellar motor protein MotA [candidate division WOR-3 bacterium]HCP16810.1 flagellar motor protein MotA [candidate division WOR-3 bacterium]
MLDLFQRGGWTMWPLLVLAITGLVFIIERFVTLLIMNKNPKKFVEELKSKIEKEGIDAAIQFCAKNPSPFARIIESALTEFQYVGKDKGAIEDAIAKAGVTELAFLDRGMPFLSVVITLAPMLGFLGTVSGMIGAFDAIALAGTVEPKLVASGISEALITTLTGLAIAIPVSAAYTYFQTVINGYSRTLEDASNKIIEILMSLEIEEA